MNDETKMNNETKLTRNTFVPISFIVVIVAAALWMGSINAKADSAIIVGDRCMRGLTVIQKDIITYMINIERRLSNIEGFVKK